MDSQSVLFFENSSRRATSAWLLNANDGECDSFGHTRSVCFGYIRFKYAQIASTPKIHRDSVGLSFVILPQAFRVGQKFLRNAGKVNVDDAVEEAAGAVTATVA